MGTCGGLLEVSERRMLFVELGGKNDSSEIGIRFVCDFGAVVVGCSET